MQSSYIENYNTIHNVHTIPNTILMLAHKRNQYDFAYSLAHFHQMDQPQIRKIAVDFGISNAERDWLTERGVTVCAPEKLAERMGEKTT